MDLTLHIVEWYTIRTDRVSWTIEGSRVILE